jgi:hypothetical protein
LLNIAQEMGKDTHSSSVFEIAQAAESVAFSHGPPNSRHRGHRGFAGPPQCRDQRFTVLSGIGRGIDDFHMLAAPAARLQLECDGPR